MTAAHWIRHFVRTHPSYKFDSVVSQEICYDLLKKCEKISSGEEPCPELFADPNTKTCAYVSDSCKKMLEEVEKITNWLKTGRNPEIAH